MHYGQIIRKGALVRIQTTNGGDTTERLLEDHRHTYDAVIVSGNGWARILHSRIVSIEEVAEPQLDFFNQPNGVT